MPGDRTLAETKLLAAIPGDRIAALDDRCRWRSFEPDEVILNLDDKTTDIYFIARGEVRVTVFSQTGRTVIMRDLKSGDHFGEYAAIDGEPRSASIVAMNRTVVAQMSTVTFQDLLAEYPEISLAVMTAMAGAIRTLNERVVEFSTLGVRNRIHAELLRLARAGRIIEGTGRISPPPTHAEIASRISTHREAVTRELKQLENQALLERTRGAFVIKDLAELERMVEDARAGRGD
jgi:CRP/FNR family transcriptional regulator, cyclic AMP receptor protein